MESLGARRLEAIVTGPKLSFCNLRRSDWWNLGGNGHDAAGPAEVVQFLDCVKAPNHRTILTMFFLEPATSKPVYPVEERPVPQVTSRVSRARRPSPFR